MLKRIIAENIQCYPKLNIRFSPGLNIIIGESDTGKTTIARIIEWSYSNEPNGEEFKEQFLRHNEKEAKVILKFDDCKIGRVRSNTKNYYLLNNRKLNAIGKGKIPEEISNALRLHDINFQSFTDPNFLFAQKDSEVAKYLNKIADLEGIESANKGIKKEKLEVDKKIKEIKKELKEKKEKLNSYKWINEIEPKIEVLLIKEQEIKKEEKRIESINKILTKLFYLKKKFKEIQIDPNLKNNIIKLENKIKIIETKEKEIQKTQSLLLKIKSKKSKFKKIKKEYFLLKKKFKKLMPKICPLCGEGKEKCIDQ